ncbi:hypothetical protein R1sor_008160 [Riccia sorocarpa]|uniref:Uncharacterized protein n=1 Tax=Riccia sorocarpa TaxID=122646 RepID=A0ABD3HUT8_9MARC
MSDEDRQRMEEAEEEEQEEGQEERAEEGAVEEAVEEADEEEADEDEIGTLELFRMIQASQTRDHAGPWCTEMAKIPYAHISNTHFREKEDLCFHIQVENKWKPLGIAAFMEDRSNNADRIGVFCEFWDEKKVVVYKVLASQYHVSGMKRSRNKKFEGEFAKSNLFWFDESRYWKSKTMLMNLFWEVRISLVQRGISSSYIVKVGAYAGMDTNRTVKPTEVFEKLVEFEEELKSVKGKNKRKTDGEGTVKLKKSRSTHAVAKVSEPKEMEPPINPMDHFSKKEEEKMMKIDFSKYKDMYPFGVSEIFKIFVTKINEAPSVFVYRSINRNYVMDTYKKMIERPGITSQVADLLPYSLKKKKLIKVEDYATTKGLSIREPRLVLDANIEDPDCDNKNNEEAHFVPSFVECLGQARRQWTALKRPKSVQGSNTKNTAFEHFKAMVSQTMGRKSHKEVILLVCCSDKTFSAFERFVLKWKQGLIPNVQGNTGRPHNDKRIEFDRDYSKLSVNRFRPVNGLSDEELKQVWTLLELGAVWVAKPAKYQGFEAVVSLKDYCKKLKATSSLDRHVVKYWPSRYREVYDKWSDLEKDYNFPDKWLESMLKYIPEKGDKEVATDEASSSDVETDDGNTRRRKKGKKKSYGVDPLPSQIASAIHRVYCAKRGESAPERLEPLEVLHIKDITKYQLTLDVKLECPLVFLDLTHPHMHAWEKPEFSSFLGIVRDLTVSKCFVVVAIMDFCQAPVDFAHALKDLKDARVTVDYGCYEVNHVHNRTDLPYPCWQLIYTFVSLVAEDYKPVLHQSISQQPFLLEIQPSKWREEVNVDEGVHAEGINLMDKAPRWKFVGMKFPHESLSFVHPLSKRRAFCEKIIMNFSSEGDTVLDFFSGGVFTREALL